MIIVSIKSIEKDPNKMGEQHKPTTINQTDFKNGIANSDCFSCEQITGRKPVK